MPKPSNEARTMVRRQAAAAAWRMVGAVLAVAGAAPLLSCGGDGAGGSSEPPPAPQMVTLTAPADLADGLAGNVTLAAAPRAGVTVVAVEFQVDGQPIGGEDTTAPFAAELDSRAFTDGQHVVRARARDAAGTRSAWATATVRFGNGTDIPAGFAKDEGWVTGLVRATALAQAPDGRLFVAEQDGALRVVKNGALLPTPFHTLQVDGSGERGLVGVALHPGFAANGFVYVYHTRVNGAARNNRVTRLTARGDVSTGSEQPLLDLPDLNGTSHNGGGMKFGADGKLYVGVGDNTDRSRPQDLGHPFGKVLRLNDDGSPATDNPFFRSQGGLGRYVWAYGLRNPYTLAVQPGSGRILVNDVGEDTWEEINAGAAGANFGWPGSEGPVNAGGGFTPPLFAYGHGDTNPPPSGPGGFITGEAVSGGTFYPASGEFPAAYRGSYYFADFLGRFVGRLDLANGNAASSFARLGGVPVDLLAGNDGALYVLTRGGITRITATLAAP